MAICVAVRDVHSGRVPAEAHRRREEGDWGRSLFNGAGIESSRPPEEAAPGQRMHFAVDVDDRCDVLTSALKSVERPPREMVAKYDRALR